MSGSIEPILHIPETVREDTLNYRGKVEKFLADQTSAVAFRGYRVPMGVYEQRAEGKFMVRIRIGAGLVLPAQLEKIAQLSKAHGNGIVHITTRQDIQIHEVEIGETPDVLEGLLEAGLSSRGGGGNTVRNVTACPRAGICPDEEFDVTAHSIATAEYLLADRSSFNLPRKYKIVFSGCPADCAFASVADLGFFAHNKDGVKGFAVYGGGGLGSNPGVAVKIEDFIEASEIFEVAEAIKRLFDKHGDRANKHKARLRYVLARVGADEFIELYRQERDTLNAEGLPYKAPEIRDIASDYPAPKGSVTVRLWLKNGDIPADDLTTVGQITAKYGQGLVRTTQLQDIHIAGVAPEDVDKVNDELKKLSINVFGDGGPKIVACTGAATCKLGLCLSRGLSDAISKKLGQTKDCDTVIRISGCPNSCANHYIADIGFQGKAKRVDGRLMPFYDVLVDARTVEGDARLAETIGAVPAKRIPDLVAEALSNGTADKEMLKSLTAKYGDISAESLPDDFYHDYGSDEPFSLAGRGPGECGAGVMDVIKLDIDEAKDALKSSPAAGENVYRAIVASARALLVTVGLEPKKDREIFAAFSEHLIEPGWVKSTSAQLLDDAIDWRMGDRESLDDLLHQVQELTERVEKLFLSLDAGLKFKIEPIERKVTAEHADEKTHTADLRGVACPLNFVKAKLELEKIEVGAVLDVLLDEGESVRNVPASFAGQGQEVVEVKESGDHFHVKVRRKK
ncbi:MAG: sulfurtransferase TusA family protein [Phycisphaerae bacterium]|nr:sulfurtransferase TusA family protein [Phycisphaerae bacterium]